MKYLLSIGTFVFIVGCGGASTAQKQNQEKVAAQYTCLPCGQDCDTAIYNEPGNCSHCNMRLVEKQTIMHKTIAPEVLCSLHNNTILFLDVRTADEFNGKAIEKYGAIKNAVNIPVQELEKRMGELESYKDKPIVVYCSHSHRSPRASYMLTRAGFKNITNMSGGMSVWKEKVTAKECNDKLYQQQ